MDLKQLVQILKPSDEMVTELAATSRTKADAVIEVRQVVFDAIEGKRLNAETIMGAIDAKLNEYEAGANPEFWRTGVSGPTEARPLPTPMRLGRRPRGEAPTGTNNGAADTTTTQATKSVPAKATPAKATAR
jgi:hypothetical protein